MTAIEAGASSIPANTDPAVTVIRSAWLAPGFYVALLFGALFLLAIGLLLLWRLARNVQRSKLAARPTLGSPWRRQYTSRLT